MYQDLIKQMNPKPVFNLSWYKDKDKYSDGDVEDLIIQLIAENTPENYTNAIYKNFSWPTYYHLTRTRKNLLNWYPFNKNADVLEIGCGLGAITGLLCDSCKSVTAVELSKRRATAALLRCREKENLEIIVGNLNDIEFHKKFDYITLIGVLEYQGTFTDTNDPYADFLKKIKGLLKPGGKLLIAIENQYGLKYWCGAKEDHTGIPFDGINQYPSTDCIRTFSKKELDTLIKRSGFANTYFYYPMPDYKLPTVIYSENKLPQHHSMENVQYYYTPDKKSLVANESDIYADIIENDVFEFFANSFLVECTDSDDFGQITFAKLCSERFSEYRTGTRFNSKSNTVEKFSLGKSNAIKHLTQMSENERILEERGLNIWKSRLDNNILTSDFANETLLEEALFKICKTGNRESFFAMFDKVYAEILLSSDEASFEDNIIYSFNPNITHNKEKYGPILKTGYLDMILRNCFLIDNNMYWFDQEWILENIPAKFVLYRAILSLYTDYPETEKIIAMEELAAHYSLIDAWDDFRNLNVLFTSAVIDQQYVKEAAVFR